MDDSQTKGTTKDKVVAVDVLKHLRDKVGCQNNTILVTKSIINILIDTMLRYLKDSLYQFIFTFIFLIGIYVYGFFLIAFFVKIKLQDHFKTDHIAMVTLVLSVILMLLTFKICYWYFKRLQGQKD